MIETLSLRIIIGNGACIVVVFSVQVSVILFHVGNRVFKDHDAFPDVRGVLEGGIYNAKPARGIIH